MDVVSTLAHGVALYEPGVWNLYVGAPKVIVAVGLQQRHDLFLRFRETTDLNQHVDDGFGGETWHGGAAKMLNPFDYCLGQRGPKKLRFSRKHLRPVWIVRRQRNFFAQCVRDALLKAFQSILK